MISSVFDFMASSTWKACSAYEKGNAGRSALHSATLATVAPRVEVVEVLVPRPGGEHGSAIAAIAAIATIAYCSL